MKKRLGLLKLDCFNHSTQQCKGSLTPQHAGTIISSDSNQLLSLRQSSHFSFKSRTPGLTLFPPWMNSPSPCRTAAHRCPLSFSSSRTPRGIVPQGMGLAGKGELPLLLGTNPAGDLVPWSGAFGPALASVHRWGVDVAAISRTAVAWVYTR